MIDKMEMICNLIIRHNDTVNSMQLLANALVEHDKDIENTFVNDRFVEVFNNIMTNAVDLCCLANHEDENRPWGVDETGYVYDTRAVQLSLDLAELYV